MITLVVVVLLSYLTGAIPWSWILVRRARGVDLRRVGSGNLGATNTYRALGSAGALGVLALDVLKGWVGPAVYARLRLDAPAVDPPVLATLAGVAAVAGHIFPVYLGFRGGKGIATTAGAFLALAPAALGIAWLAFAAGLLSTRGIVSVGSLLGATALPVAIAALGGPGGPAPDRLAAAVAIAVVVWLKHASNLARLVRGEEKRLFSRRRTT